MIIEGRTGPWEIVIGLEVHAQVVSEAKLFSGASAAFGAEPNTHVSPVDAAFPGMLPVINRHCVEQAVRTGLGLEAQINMVSVFDRKNYFYADLPSGYQISQYTRPVVGEGKITLDMEDGSTREIGITRLHLEQDAGKSLHDQNPTMTYVDLNRAGVALMEIVSEPDLRSPEEAGAYLRKLRSILRYLGTCDGNMEEGSMRCDCNVSVRHPGDAYGTRCEIKNVNSVRFVMQAIEIEARRQVELIEDGGAVIQQTRLFDPNRGETRPMRSKEQAHDYRYFPEPDLAPLRISDAWRESVRAKMPELPASRRKRFIEDHGLREYDADVLTATRAMSEYFEKVVAASGDARAAAKWVMGDLSALLKQEGREIEESPISAENLGQLLALMAEGKINGKLAKDIFPKMEVANEAAEVIMKREGLESISDEGALGKIIDEVIAANPKQVEQYKSGKQQVIGFLVGQVMKASRGQADPAVVNRMFKEKL